MRASGGSATDLLQIRETAAPEVGRAPSHEQSGKGGGVSHRQGGAGLLPSPGSPPPATGSGEGLLRYLSARRRAKR